MSNAVIVRVAQPTFLYSSEPCVEIDSRRFVLLTSVNVFESANLYWVFNTGSNDFKQYEIPYTIGPNTGPLPASSTPRTTGSSGLVRISEGMDERKVVEWVGGGSGTDGGMKSSLHVSLVLRVFFFGSGVSSESSITSISDS
ncbi:hypothetical protein WICPIJ_005839 [Wickerhamomyces pijperi]|uniref:Uncharacterized protein n=1 Tax=Wickerhamomyces pijperi TaxID=599730 RepID=A0A9P8TLJ6_WICPI|nr:hypothetical protein WICPIJ_005839 [Wickerhamomyces pijperi]